MIRIAVVDDQEISCLYIKSMLKDYNFKKDIEVECFTDGATMLRSSLEKKYDILIMDIELSEEHREVEENGMYLASKIKTMYPDIAVIYITGKSGHTKELLQHEPFRYIEKPIKEKEICKAVYDAIYRIESSDKLFNFHKEKVTYFTEIRKITFFESDRRKIVMHIVDEGDIIFYEKMDQLERRLQEISESFVRVGRSFLVNMYYIKKTSREQIELHDGTIVPLSPKYRDEAIRRIEARTRF